MKDNYYNEEEFYSRLYKQIVVSVKRNIDDFPEFKQFYEEEDLIQMAFLKCFQPRKVDNASLYDRYLNQPYKYWHTNLGSRAARHVFTDLFKSGITSYKVIDKVMVLDPNEITQFGYKPKTNGINEFLDLYGDIMVGKKYKVKLKDVLQDVIAGYNITDTCLKHHVKTSDFRAMLEKLEFRNYLQ